MIHLTGITILMLIFSVTTKQAESYLCNSLKFDIQTKQNMTFCYYCFSFPAFQWSVRPSITRINRSAFRADGGRGVFNQLGLGRWSYHASPMWSGSGHYKPLQHSNGGVKFIHRKHSWYSWNNLESLYQPRVRYALWSDEMLRATNLAKLCHYQRLASLFTMVWGKR